MDLLRNHHLLAATITGQTCHYDTLTEDIIHNHLNTVKMNLVNPTHLFVTEQGAKDLSDILAQTYWYGIDIQKGAPILRTYMGMYVVVLPTLPENTLIMGTLQLNDR